MFHLKCFCYFILVHLIVSTPQINLYYTDWVSQSESENDNALQHDCLRVVALIEQARVWVCEGEGVGVSVWVCGCVGVWVGVGMSVGG
jgi:hypothetical protein